jgi:hypothetical protein
MSLETYLDLTKNARMKVEQLHNHDRMVEGMNDLYQSVLKEAL